MSRYLLATIVEGHGETESLPVLVRRLCPNVQPARPIRVKRQRITDPVELSRYLQIAESNIVDAGGKGAILLLLDADKDCAASLGPKFETQMAAVVPHRHVRCVLAVREFESWLVAGEQEAATEDDDLRGTKGWLKTKYGLYSPTVDQPRLTASLNVELAKTRSRSLRRLLKVLTEIDVIASS